MTREDDSPIRPELLRKEIIKGNLAELERRKEAGEIHPDNFHLGRIFEIVDEKYDSRAITRKDLLDKETGLEHALVMTAAELWNFCDMETIKSIRILYKDGREKKIWAKDFCSDPDDEESILVIFPEDLGCGSAENMA